VNFYTVVCGRSDCTWSFGPTSKKHMREARHMHKEIHRLEDILEEAALAAEQDR
jgi:hypothetical protein